MSTYTPKEGSGALFKNDKQGNENCPDYRGDLFVNGVMLEVAGWIKDGAKGKFMSLSAKPKEQQQAAQSKPAPQQAPADDGFSDLDVPF